MNAERVKIAHGLWVPFSDGGPLHHASRSSLQTVPAANRAAELQELATKAAKYRMAIENALAAFDK